MLLSLSQMNDILSLDTGLHQTQIIM